MGCHSTSDAPSLRWRLCCPFAGIVAFVALAASPSFCWQLCPHFFCAGIVVLGAPVLPLALHWPLCQCCAGVVALVTLASLPSLCWHHCPCCAGVSTIDVLALFPFALALSSSSCWHLHQCCSGVIAFVAMVSPPLPFIRLLPSVTLSLTLTTALTSMRCPNLPRLTFAMANIAMPL